LRYLVTLLFAALSFNAFGQCNTTVSFDTWLSGGQSTSQNMSLGGTLTQVQFNLNFYASGGEYPADMIVVITGANGNCMAGEGFNIAPPSTCYDINFPGTWTTSANGFYTYTMSALAAGISGDGTWFFDLQNGSDNASSNANYDLDIILFGVCDQGDCMEPLACNYNPDASFEDNSFCEYPSFGYDCSENCINDIDGDGVCDADELLGCTNPTASNYDPEATEVDGSCIYTGCLDSTACNYNPDAIEDDGNCDYSCCPGPGCCNDGTYWDDVTQTCLLDITFCSWQPDSNADGNIGIGDLLDLLSVFGDTDYDEDGVFDSVDDCVDPAACNYQANPTEPCAYIDVLGVCGGGCEADEDGDAICDDIDDCIGVIDECGVCNGPGATEIVIDNITILYDSVYLPQLEEWYVYEFGADTTFIYNCAPNFGDCGEPVSHEGYDYTTVQIGEQCWFAENCRYLPVVSPSNEGNSTDPYYYVYGYEGTDVEEAKATYNYEAYGVLYNWPAVMTDGICPSGWHVPSDGEWQTMEISLGMSESEAAQTGWRGSPVGDYMKSTSGWNNGGNGSNSSGFNGLPGGYRFSGGFNLDGSYGYWWSASESGSDSWERELHSSNDDVVRVNSSRYDGFSARCVRD
jgi:uncharacterized protein (TIGR02145 family)